MHFGLNRHAFAVFTWFSEEEGGSFISKFKLESIVVMKTETTSSLKLNVTHLDVKIRARKCYSVPFRDKVGILSWQTVLKKPVWLVVLEVILASKSQVGISEGLNTLCMWQWTEVSKTLMYLQPDLSKVSKKNDCGWFVLRISLDSIKVHLNVILTRLHSYYLLITIPS